MSPETSSLASEPSVLVALIAVCAGYLIAPMGLSAVNVAIPALALDLQASAAQVGWLPTVYILSSVMCFLPASRLADRYGRKRVFVYGLWVNGLAATVSSISSNMDVILLLRFVQGIAAAMIFGTGVAIVSSIVPANKRGMALGIVASCVYVGLTLAPVAGGYLTEFMGWRSVFWFQVPLIVLLLVYIAIKLPGEWKDSETHAVDWLGTAVFALFSCLFVLGMAQLPSWYGVTTVCASFGALWLFIYLQIHTETPLIRVQMFRENRLFSLSLTSSLFMYGSNFALLFLLSVYLQFIHNLSPSQAGNILLFQALSMAIMAPVAGKLADRFASRVVATIGCSIVAVGLFLLNIPLIMAEPWWIGLALLILGIGFGLFSTPNNNSIVSSVTKAEIGVASAAMNLGRTVGNLIGMSVVNTMIHIIIGDVPIESASLDDIANTVELALMLSLGMVLCACIASGARGR